MRDRNGPLRHLASRFPHIFTSTVRSCDKSMIMPDKDLKSSPASKWEAELSYAHSEIAIYERERALQSILDLMHWHNISLDDLSTKLDRHNDAANAQGG